MAGNATVCHALQAAVQSRAGLHRPKGSPVGQGAAAAEGLLLVLCMQTLKQVWEEGWAGDVLGERQRTEVGSGGPLSV